MFATSMRQPSSSYGVSSQWRATFAMRRRSSGELQFTFGKVRTPIHAS
jgi:hypothetical protein